LISLDLASLLIEKRGSGMMVYGCKIPRYFALLVVGAVVTLGQSARADQTLWYNGDMDGRDAFTNQTGAPDGLIYDNFIVPVGQTFTLTGVFSNNVMLDDGTASTAYYEIRSGVSAGNGGTLLYSGDGADSITATGRTFSFGGLVVPEFTNLVAVSGITLAAGTYWLAVAPDVSDQDSFISTTSGANAVGSPPGNDGNSFFSSSYFGISFLPTSDPSLEDAGTWDYSMGVMGVANSTSVPEPSTLVLGLLGLVTAGGFFCARRRQA
jgi:PEP-CTERM motif